MKAEFSCESMSGVDSSSYFYLKLRESNIIKLTKEIGQTSHAIVNWKQNKVFEAKSGVCRAIEIVKLFINN